MFRYTASTSGISLSLKYVPVIWSLGSNSLNYCNFLKISLIWASYSTSIEPKMCSIVVVFLDGCRRFSVPLIVAIFVKEDIFSPVVFFEDIPAPYFIDFVCVFSSTLVTEIPVFFMVLYRYLFCGVDKVLKASFVRSKLLISDESICVAGCINVLLAPLVIDLYLCYLLLESSFGYRV